MSRTKDPTKFDNLRFRPFLVVEAYTHPTKSAHTEMKGWQKVPGSQEVTEHPALVDRVSKRTWLRSQIIIDVINDCLIKSDLQGDRTEILNNYKKKYAEMVNHSKAAWASRELLKQKASSGQYAESDWQAI